MNIPTEKNASSLRRYFYEYVVIGLCVCVVTLFGLYYKLNEQIKNDYRSVIQTNTEALNNFILINQNKKQ